MTIHRDNKSYGDIGGPKAFIFGGRYGRTERPYVLANSQSTVDRDYAEALVLAELRHRLTDGIWRPVAGEWDDLADDLEPLASLDYNPKRSIVAAGGAERWPL